MATQKLTRGAQYHSASDFSTLLQCFGRRGEERKRRRKREEKRRRGGEERGGGGGIKGGGKSDRRRRMNYELYSSIILIINPTIYI